jgi:DNA-binding transcriptional regulator YhcF (GntR family)
MTASPGSVGLPRYARVAASIRGQIADGTLRPGQPAPSGAALSRVTGYSTLTCRKALRVLIADGVLVPGPSRNARPRVAGPRTLPAEKDLSDATRALSAGLAARRRAAGLTQAELAARAAASVTTVGHAETGRVWQSRRFWERADDALGAAGELLRLHDEYRATGAVREQGPGRERGLGLEQGQRQRQQAQAAQEERTGVTAHRHPFPAVGSGPAVVPGQPGPAGPSCIMIVWGDGTVTTVRPPGVTLPVDGVPVDGVHIDGGGSL